MRRLISLYSTDLVGLANHFLEREPVSLHPWIWHVDLLHRGSCLPGGRGSGVSLPVSQQCWPWQSWWNLQSEPFPFHSCWWSRVVAGALATPENTKWQRYYKKNRMVREWFNVVLRITIWDHRVQEWDSHRVLQDGAREHVLQQKEHRLWSQGERFWNSASFVTSIGQVTLLEFQLPHLETDQQGSSV